MYSTATVIFIIGLALFAHATYLMYEIVNVETVEHPGGLAGFSPASVTSSSISPVQIGASAEVLMGFLLVMGSYIRFSTFKRARLSDVTKSQRFDSALNTGYGFIHFNHRGALGDGRKRAPHLTPGDR